MHRSNPVTLKTCKFAYIHRGLLHSLTKLHHVQPLCADLAFQSLGHYTTHVAPQVLSAVICPILHNNVGTFRYDCDVTNCQLTHQPTRLSNMRSKRGGGLQPRALACIHNILVCPKQCGG